MQIVFIATNYNNSFHTENLVRSFAQANVEESHSHMVIVDNSSDDVNKDILANLDKEFEWLHIIYNSENVGYFQGLNDGLEYVEDNFKSLDFVVVGNNDLLVPKDFISSIQAHSDTLSKHFVTCPNIISADAKHQNPHVIHGFSKLRWAVWELYYSSYQISRLVLSCAKLLGDLGARKDRNQHSNAREIAAGYGACYILNNDFRQSCRRLFMPTFLMQEEYFLSYQLKQFNQRPYYLPDIRISHVEHATVKKIPKRKIWQYERDSFRMMKKLERDAQVYH